VHKVLNLLLSLSLLQLAACNNDSNNEPSCIDAVPVSFSDGGIFNGVSQRISFSGNSANQLGIVCHNCYDNSRLDLSDTLSKIDKAVINNVDFIELDIIQEDRDGAEVLISHGDNAQGISNEGVSFRKVVEREILVDALPMLFIEIKRGIKSRDKVRAFLNTLKSQKNSAGYLAYFRYDRFTTIRSSGDYQTLSAFRDVLNEPEFADIKPFVKLSRLFFSSATSQDIEQASQCGLNIVEFDIKTNLNAIDELNRSAESYGMSVALFTLDESNYDELIEKFKDDIDIIIVDENETLFSDNVDTSLFIRVRNLITFI
jgi:hypothetical protein